MLPDRAACWSEDGQSTILGALFIGMFLLGFVAFAIDGQNLFHARRMAQSAADAAAMAAAEESTNGTTTMQTSANDIARLNGFDTTLSKNPATVTLSTPSGGDYSGSTSYVQAVVSKPVQTYFINVLTRTPTVTVSARAVAAAGQTSPTCVCLEGGTGQDLNLSNASKLSATGCGVTVDSSSSNAVGVIGGGNLSSQSLGTVSSTWNNSSNINNGGSISNTTRIVQGISTQCAPPMPAVPTYSSSQCTADPLTHFGSGGSSYNVGPGASYTTTQSGNLACYNSLTVGANGDKVNLNPGIYVINGGTLHFESGSNNASNTGGSGVFFYLTGNANLVIDNGANVALAAPGSGTYSGDIFFQDPADTQSMLIQGGSNTSLSGTIYAPSSALTLGNGSNTTINAEVVANTLTMNGGGTLASTAVTSLGTLNITVAKVTE
jgi:Flp pilus assembly protein TadG